MTTKVVPGLLIATPDSEGVAREASSRIGRALRDAIATRGSATLALSGGETPKAAYALLAKDTRVDWKCVQIFWVDERAVPPTDDRSNYRWAKEALLVPSGIPEANVHRMPADAKDLAGAAREYEQIVKNKVSPGQKGFPAFDVVVLGIGNDGHTASLFPGDSGVDVIDRAVIAVPAAEGREARLSLTVPVLEQTRNCVVLAVGKGKQAALERVWSTSGDVHQTPARAIRGVRGGILWVIDKAAGGLG